MRCLPALLAALAFTASGFAREFTVLDYNVENLVDLDGVSPFEDYQPPRYTPAHMQTKLENIARVVAQLEGGRGPDLILFQEIELDFTPADRPIDYAAVVKRYADVPLATLLGAKRTPDVEDLPAEALLLKAFADAGLTGYTVVAADQRPAQENGEHTIAHKNVVFTRFPVREVHTLRNTGARDTLEVVVEVDGHPLHVFSNHWKSGAGSPETEPTRIANARVLRERIDALLAADPHADLVIGGDLNSQYNQKQRYGRAMKQTGINDVLRSQGNELAIRGPQRDLYNLWFELPPEQRGSDTYRGEWGTLMHLILSRGLYDQRGVQYIDNSFAVLRVPGLNADIAGAPIRFSFDGPGGSGFSDHFPIYARFRTVADDRPDRWIALVRPSERETGDEPPQRVDYSTADVKSLALSAAKLPAGANLRDGSWTGKVFLVEGEISTQRFSIEAFGDTWEVYAPDAAVRTKFWEGRKPGDRVRFHGELGTYKGKWQFVIRDAAWLAP